MARPVFARMYPRIAGRAEGRGGAAHRRRALAGLRGRVVEVGAGHGANFRHYPATVDEVVAIEPEPHLRERARLAAREAPVPVSVRDGVAERLPGEAQSFDAGVVSLVLCTVPDQGRALAELHRVIRLDGELRFYEHVASQSAWEARVQRLADLTVWPRISGGCHMARDTTAAIERAGFQIETLERFGFSPLASLPPAPHVLGVARRG
ncbi:MAG: class I SAM-dependent methyltransferase [Solirubrobacterales bacterium]|nr:class I SAM-dependent methyltransferase [Solirubrobacterales bacterium]